MQLSDKNRYFLWNAGLALLCLAVAAGSATWLVMGIYSKSMPIGQAVGISALAVFALFMGIVFADNISPMVGEWIDEMFE